MNELANELKELIISFTDVDTKLQLRKVDSTFKSLIPETEIIQHFLNKVGSSQQYFSDMIRALGKGKSQINFNPRNSYQRRFIYFLAERFNYRYETTINHKKHHHNFRIEENPDDYVVHRSKTSFVQIILYRGREKENLRIESICTDSDPRFRTCGKKEITHYPKNEGWTESRILKLYPEYLHRNFRAGNY